MPNPLSLEEIERCLCGHGYPCRTIAAETLATELPTEEYVNREGGRSLLVHVSLAEAGGMLVIDAPAAFDLDSSPHREAALACLQAASARTAVVKLHLDPVHGDIRFRVDCLIGEQGLAAADMLRLLALVVTAADRWHADIRAALDEGTVTVGPCPMAVEKQKLRSLTRRAGGVNRLEALFRIHEHRRPEPGAEPSSN